LRLTQKLGKSDTDIQIQHTLKRNRFEGLLKLNDLPEPWKINPYILTSYPFTDSVAACWKCIFRMSNESFNIWSHLLPILAIAVAAMKFDILRKISTQDMTADEIIFVAYIFAVTISLSCSVSWHTMKCISDQHIFCIFSSVDMTGISILISTTAIMTQYTAFYYNGTKQVIYMVFTLLCGFVCIALSWQAWMRVPGAAWVRVSLFVWLALMGLVPAIDMAFTQGINQALQHYRPIMYKVVAPVF
jgi:adiponectin receptor